MDTASSSARFPAHGYVGIAIMLLAEDCYSQQSVRRALVYADYLDWLYSFPQTRWSSSLKGDRW